MTQAEMVSPNPSYWLVVSGKISGQASQWVERQAEISGDSFSGEFNSR
jgi:hypothetical protein